MRALLASAVVLATVALHPARSGATVDDYVWYRVPYQHLQSGDVCLMRLPLKTSLGIPQAAMAAASLKQTRILQDQPTSAYVNINLAAPSTAMVHTYVADAVTASGVWEYGMKLDVTALSAANGTSLAGRTRTVRAAKLALVAIAKNMEDLSEGNYRLKVTFVGLPSQTSLPGTKLNATTAYAYTVSSPLLNAYLAELIDVGGSCPE